MHCKILFNHEKLVKVKNLEKTPIDYVITGKDTSIYKGRERKSNAVENLT